MNSASLLAGFEAFDADKAVERLTGRRRAGGGSICTDRRRQRGLSDITHDEMMPPPPTIDLMDEIDEQSGDKEMKNLHMRQPAFHRPRKSPCSTVLHDPRK